MGLHNRTYWKENGQESFSGGFSLGLPSLGRVVKILLIINVVMFVLQMFLDQPSRGGLGSLTLALGASAADWWQVWRYVTFQFLHADFWHIAMNMLGLYMLGSPLEQHWGPRRFLGFYLGCGAFGGLIYVAVCAFVRGGNQHVPMIGASGGIFGILLACAILFPQFKLILFIFPVPIRLAAVLVFGAMVLTVFGTFNTKSFSPDFWSDTCHLGGAVAAALYIWVVPRLGEMRWANPAGGGASRSGAWKRRMDRMAAEQAQIDRILQKIHDQGLASLTRKEKAMLKNATLRQQAQENEAYKP